MTINERIARSIATQPCLDLAPDGELTFNSSGRMCLPPRVTDKVIACRARVHERTRAANAAKRKKAVKP